MQKYFYPWMKNIILQTFANFKKLGDMKLRVEITFDKFLFKLQLGENMDLLTLQCMLQKPPLFLEM